LIEEDANLQQTAAIADHLIPTLANYLRKNNLNDEEYARMREVAYLFLRLITIEIIKGASRVNFGSAAMGAN
jgi:hypothetical protein